MGVVLTACQSEICRNVLVERKPAKKTEAKTPEKRGRSTDPMAKWLRAVRALKGLEQSDLALYIGRSRSAVAMYESGSPVPLDVVAAIVDAFDEIPRPPTDGELKMQGTVSSDRLYANIKYAGVVPCSSDWGDPLSSVETRPIDPKFAGARRFMCKVVGDSCFPALQPGDLTIWESDQDPPYGVIVIAERTEDRACTVKELIRDERENRPRLRPISPTAEAPPDDGGWQVTARLVGVITKAEGPERTWYWEPGLRPRHLDRKET